MKNLTTDDLKKIILAIRNKTYLWKEQATSSLQMMSDTEVIEEFIRLIIDIESAVANHENYYHRNHDD